MNALAGAGEQIVIGATFFILYSVLIRMAGADAVGVMSLTLLLASLGNVANIGFGGSLLRYVPMYESANDRAMTLRSIETATVCAFLIYSALLIVSYMPFRIFVVAQAGPKYAELAKIMMLPASLYVLALGLGSVTNSALTAIQRNDMRLMATLPSAITCLAIVILGTPRYGVIAGLWALAAQAGVFFVLTWLFLLRSLPGLAIVPYRLSRANAGTLLKLGFSLQSQGLLMAAVEPVTRLLVGQFGTLTQVAYFAMSARFVLQLRGVFFSAAQSVLPALGYLRGTDAVGHHQLYEDACAKISFAALVVMSATAGAAPFVGELWIGHHEPIFVTFAIIQAVGWLGLTLTLGSYFNAYALGHQHWNITGHIVMALTNILLGPVLAAWFGGTGAVMAMAIALSLAGLVMGVGNARLEPHARSVRAAIDLPVAIVTAVAATLAVVAYAWCRSHVSMLLAGMTSGTVWAIIVGPMLFMHPTVANPVRRLLRLRITTNRNT